MNNTLSVVEGSTKGESVKGKQGFLEDLNKVLSEWSDFILDWTKARRVGEKREANTKLNLKKKELENLVREGMGSPGTVIKIYEKLNRLFNQVAKHRSSVQYLILSSIVEKIDNYKGGKARQREVLV